MVLHAFPEQSEEGMQGHLEFWYGATRFDADDTVVCWCGAHFVKFSDTVSVIYHLRSFDV
jgi:hypothetical protein